MSKPGTPPPNGPRGRGYGYIDPSAPWPMRAVMAVYRFLASLKLAVISLLSLAGSLAYATIYVEKNYGTIAVNEWVYESAWFSILLAFLATNILCAALIRFPWKKRQIGFVVTHAGLLVLIFGAWWGFQFSDEGQAGAVEGGKVDKLIRTKHPLIRVQELDERTGQAAVERELPFNGGALDWPRGKYEVVSRPKDPFKVAVTGYHPASRYAGTEYVAAKDGVPALKLRARAKPPGGADAMDAFGPDQRWFPISRRLIGDRLTKRAGGAKFAFVYVDRPEMVEDFLNPPKDPGTLGVARLRYADSSGEPRVHEVRLDDARPGVAIPLPGSDLTASFIDAVRREPERADLRESFGDDEIYAVSFAVRKGNGPEITHMGFAGQPMFPPVLAQEGREEPLLAVSYYRPPLLGGGMGRTLGVVEVMGDPQGHLYYRIFARDESAVPAEQASKPRPSLLAKPPAPLKTGERIVAFGGTPLRPMTVDFTAEDYLTSSREMVIYDRQPMPDGKQGDGLAAARVEITVGDESRDVWVQRPAGLEMPPFTPVRFRGKDYAVAFDSEREPLGFAMTLKDFEVGYDPGTSKPSSYKSEVLLTDEKAGLKDQPITITMNHPLTHRKLTFYQSSFHPSESGDFVSVFQVGHDAGRPLKYAGSLLLVLGVFLQFTMRAGLFSHAAKDNTKAADRARKILKKKGEKAPAAPERKNKAKKTKSYDDAIL